MAKEKVKHLSGVFASVFAHHGHITKEEAKEISGLDLMDKVVDLDQSPIGRIHSCHITDAGPALGVHLGPGGLVVGFAAAAQRS